MNYQKLILAVLASFVCLISSPALGQTIVGVRAGLNLSHISLVNEAGEKQHTDLIPRLQIGLTVDIPLSMDLYLQPGAFYSGKGFKQDGGWIIADGNVFKAKADYVEVPINLVYRSQFRAGNLMLGAGPYVGYGIGGKWEGEGQILVGDIILSESSGDIIFKKDIKDGEYGNYLYGKPWDYGINVLVGYEFLQRIPVQLNAQWGIANLAPDIDGNPQDGSIRNRSYGISVGYRF